jgi:hypothetical protein
MGGGGLVGLTTHRRNASLAGWGAAAGWARRRRSPWGRFVRAPRGRSAAERRGGDGSEREQIWRAERRGGGDVTPRRRSACGVGPCRRIRALYVKD